MPTKLRLTISILLVISACSSSHEECQLKDENDLLDDCHCHISDLTTFNNQRLYPLLHRIVTKNYFRFFPVNLHKNCLFWPDDGQCSRQTCAINSCPMDQLPEGLRSRAARSQDDCSTMETNSTLGSVNKNISDADKQTIEHWIQFDDQQSDNFCDVEDEMSVDLEHIDLAINPERYTGYAGPSAHRVWSAIYDENCFFLPDSKIFYDLRDKRLNTHQMCLEGRTFYRLISGLHTSITIHLCAQYFFPTVGFSYSGADGRWGANIAEFRSRFAPELTAGEGPKWLKNVYFLYLIELQAVFKARDFLRGQTYFTGNASDDLDTQELISNQLMKAIEPFANYFDEQHLFQNGNELLKIEFKQHFRNISRIMDCVGCDKCKLWGKLQVQALGTALKILFSERPIQLQRSEIVSLINGFNQLSISLYHLENTFKTWIEKKT